MLKRPKLLNGVQGKFFIFILFFLSMAVHAVYGSSQAWSGNYVATVDSCGSELHL